MICQLGIPMLFPLTWEENVAAAMTKIPLFEIFPGLLVAGLYKSYREGVAAGKIAPWNPDMPDDYVIGYVSDSTGKRADVVRDFFDALVRTIAAGKAPADALLGKAPSGIGEKIAEGSGEAAASYTKAVTGPLTALAVLGVSVAVIYALTKLKPERA
jgi:hypothetical protein